MKILFTGGGTGGHFYPIIAVAEALREEAKARKVLQPEFFYMAPTKYNPRALFDNEITFIYVPAGKIRRYFSLLNITDMIKTVTGIFSATISMFRIYPDVAFGKGGYASFPALVAARILGIPYIIHESDSRPGRANIWVAKHARRVALSYPEAADAFKKLGVKAENIAFTGNPVRKEVAIPLTNGAREYLGLGGNLPVIFIIGGSQGSQLINNTIIDCIKELVQKYQVIHQTGKANFDEVQKTVSFILKDDPNAGNYKAFAYMNDLTIRMSAGIASVVVSRAGSSIFEIAQWGVPSIIIPLNQKISNDQTENAFSYARAGGCVVIEEHNLTSHVLMSQIASILGNEKTKNSLIEGAKNFAKPDAATKIARVLLEIALEHQ